MLHKKTLNFQGIEDTSQQLCAHCPYLREEWSKGLVHDPDRYKPRETLSYHHGPSVQLQQANINTILSKSCSHCRVIPSAACHELQQGGSQATWHHCPVTSEERPENSGNVAVFPYFWSVQQNWTLLKKKIREYWKQTTWLNQTKPNQVSSYRRGGELRILYVLLRSYTFSILFSSPGDSVLWALIQRRPLALGTYPLGWTLEWLAEFAWSP